MPRHLFATLPVNGVNGSNAPTAKWEVSLPREKPNPMRNPLHIIGGVLLALSLGTTAEAQRATSSDHALPWYRTQAHPHAASPGERGGAPANDECSGAIQLTLVPLADCGTSSTFGDNSAATDSGPMDCDFSDDGFQDVWYTFNSGSHSEVYIMVNMMSIEDLVLEVTTDGCDNPTVVDCDVTEALTLTVAPNTDYWVRVASNTDYGFGGTFSICAAYAGDAPANDHCSDVTPVALAVGSSITFTGNNVGATSDGDAEPGSVLDGMDPTVWHAFTLSECAAVSVSYCGTPGPFEEVWVFLSPNCPAGDDYILAASYNWTDCADGNTTLYYTDLAPGTYYLPVLWELDYASGPYTIEVSATECDVYCAASAVDAGFESINQVDFAGINNSVDSEQGYIAFLNMTAQVAQGGSYPISITVDDGWSSDQVLVWIDFNGNFVFDANELVMTSNGEGPQHTGTIAVPADAMLGGTRMRIRLQDTDFSPNSTPCGTNSYGQVQDYSVNIEVGTGVAGMERTSIQVYPNPGNGDLTVVMPEATGNVNLEVLDMTGRVVHAATAMADAGSRVQVALAGKVAPGSYVLRVSNQDVRTEQRIVIQ